MKVLVARSPKSQMSILLPESGRNGPEKLTLRNDKGGGFGNGSEGQQYKQKHNIQRHPGGWKKIKMGTGH